MFSLGLSLSLTQNDHCGLIYILRPDRQDLLTAPKLYVRYIFLAPLSLCFSVPYAGLIFPHFDPV